MDAGPVCPGHLAVHFGEHTAGLSSGLHRIIHRYAETHVPTIIGRAHGNHGDIDRQVAFPKEPGQFGKEAGNIVGPAGVHSRFGGAADECCRMPEAASERRISIGAVVHWHHMEYVYAGQPRRLLLQCSRQLQRYPRTVAQYDMVTGPNKAGHRRGRIAQSALVFIARIHHVSPRFWPGSSRTTSSSPHLIVWIS